MVPSLYRCGADAEWGKAGKRGIPREAQGRNGRGADRLSRSSLLRQHCGGWFMLATPTQMCSRPWVKQAFKASFGSTMPRWVEHQRHRESASRMAHFAGKLKRLQPPPQLLNPQLTLSRVTRGCRKVVLLDRELGRRLTGASGVAEPDISSR